MAFFWSNNKPMRNLITVDITEYPSITIESNKTTIELDISDLKLYFSSKNTDLITNKISKALELDLKNFKIRLN